MLRPRRRRRPSSRRRTAAALVRELPRLLLLIGRLLRDARVSGADRALFVLVMAYVIAPIDLLPDFLGVFGLVDDLYLVGLALGRLFGRAGPDVLLEHWSGDPRTLGYLIEGVDKLGTLLPPSVRRTLHKTAKRVG